MDTAAPTSTMSRPSDVALSEADRRAGMSSGVSWGAILAGAAGAAALSLILVILGTGLGLYSVSPWTGQGVSAAVFGASTIAWLTFTQLAASGMGGYLAGRLRTRWTGIHTDEVYFRDTAHGFLAWAVAALLTAALSTSVIGSILGKGAQASAAAAGSVSTAAAAVGLGAAASKAGSSSGSDLGMGYFVDLLFRKDADGSTAAPPGADTSAAASTAEVARIFAESIRAGALSPEDSRYVGQLVSQRIGLSQADADKRVADTFSTLQAKVADAETAAREAADKTRKASAGVALWLFISLLIGAFGASFAATYGGARRDH